MQMANDAKEQVEEVESSEKEAEQEQQQEQPELDKKGGKSGVNEKQIEQDVIIHKTNDPSRNDLNDINNYEDNSNSNDDVNIDISLTNNNNISNERDCLQLPEHESGKLDVLPNLYNRYDINKSKLSNNSGPSEEEEFAHPVQEETLTDELKNFKGTEYRKVGWMRHYVAIFALIGIVLANCNRQAFNQALVKMARQGKSTNITTTTTTTANSLLIKEDTTFTQQPPTIAGEFLSTSETITSTERILTDETLIDSDEDTFDWNSDDIKKLQSAFSYGYIPFMIFSARISELYGAKWVIFVSGFGSALCCILSPFLADTNYYLLMASRIMMGLCQTGVSPALYALLVRWLPPDESSVYLPMMKVGATLGFTFGSVIAGFFTWRKTFYIVAGIGFIWSIIWPLTVESDPDSSRFVSNDEFKFIRQEIGKLNKDRKQSMTSSRKKNAPWIQIFTHPVVLAFMLTKLTVKMSTDAQTQQFCMYLKAVFNMDDKQNGLLNGINYAIQALFTGLVAWSAQEFVVRKTFGLNKTGVRKLYQGICNFGMGIAFISITFNMSSITLVCCSYLLLSIASMFGAGGEAVLPVDLTTDYAATIMSIANFTANLSGIILPEIVANILQDNRTDPARWNLIWWIVGCIMCLGGLMFTLFVKAEILNFERSFLIDFYKYVRIKLSGNRNLNKGNGKNGEENSDTIRSSLNNIQMTTIQITGGLHSIQEASD